MIDKFAKFLRQNGVKNRFNRKQKTITVNNGAHTFYNKAFFPPLFFRFNEDGYIHVYQIYSPGITLDIRANTIEALIAKLLRLGVISLQYVKLLFPLYATVDKSGSKDSSTIDKVETLPNQKKIRKQNSGICSEILSRYRSLTKPIDRAA